MSDTDWPPDHVPMAHRVDVQGTVRGGEPVARLILTDPGGEARQIDLTETVALSLLVQVSQFL